MDAGVAGRAGHDFVRTSAQSTMVFTPLLDGVRYSAVVSHVLTTLANEVAGRELSGLSEHWFDDSRCECCKQTTGVPLSSLYKTEIHKNCFGGSDEIGWRLVDVLAQTTDGTLTVEPQAQRRVCASHRCRGSITVFWDAVHDCAASGYWKVVALAFATAKSQCHRLDQDVQESGQWLARIRATFHGIDTADDAAMLNVERMAELSAVEALSSSAHGVQIQSHELEVKCSSVPKFQGELGQDSVRQWTGEKGSGNHSQAESRPSPTFPDI
eukprot:s2256_g7.t1